MLMRLVYCLASLVCVILCGLRSGQDAMRAMRHATPRPLILHYRLRSLLVALGAVLLCSRWGGGEAASVRTSRVEHPAPVCCGSRGVIRLVRPLALLRRRPPLHTREDPVQRVGQSGVGASLGQLTHHLLVDPPWCLLLDQMVKRLHPRLGGVVRDAVEDGADVLGGVLGRNALPHHPRLRRALHRVELPHQPGHREHLAHHRLGLHRNRRAERVEDGGHERVRRGEDGGTLVLRHGGQRDRTHHRLVRHRGAPGAQAVQRRRRDKRHDHVRRLEAERTAGLLGDGGQHTDKYHFAPIQHSLVVRGHSHQPREGLAQRSRLLGVAR
mmetsp:Transcript_23130/g.74905  ORF Transcript_23130/g.74905 Transcript_23130/m.74905 type:complete len:326 (-) Transcript_23130:3677-4654(-)